MPQGAHALAHLLHALPKAHSDSMTPLAQRAYERLTASTALRDLLASKRYTAKPPGILRATPKPQWAALPARVGCSRSTPASRP